jgi:hypothetical protein
MRIQKSHFPDEVLSENEWYQKFKVGSRREKYHKENNSREMNSQYDFSKYYSTQESYLSKILKYINFINI